MNFEYSIVLPAYNERQRIEKALQSILACIQACGWIAEVIVVDDGSTDDTAAIVSRFAEENGNVSLIRNPMNRGKGYSVRNGVLHAQGRTVLFTDTDMSTPIEEAKRLFAAIESGADVAIGSRWLQRDLQTNQQPLYRRFFGRCFNLVTRLFVRLPFVDTQCGFKAFTNQAARRLFLLQTIERWGFDPEILFNAVHCGMRVVEVPVSWGHDDRSKVSYFKDGSRMLLDLARIRINSLLGRYRGNAITSERREPADHTLRP